MSTHKTAAAKPRVVSGLLGSIGDAISGTFDGVFKVADVAGAALTDKLELGKYKEQVEDEF